MDGKHFVEREIKLRIEKHFNPKVPACTIFFYNYRQKRRKCVKL